MFSLRIKRELVGKFVGLGVKIPDLCILNSAVPMLMRFHCKACFSLEHDVIILLDARWWWLFLAQHTGTCGRHFYNEILLIH